METQAEFNQPTYFKNNKAKVGALVVSIPDGFEYVTQDHIPSKDNTATAVLGDYAMIAAPSDCDGGFGDYKDATLGINISGPKKSIIREEEWKSIDAIKNKLNSSALGRRLKGAKAAPGFIVGYGKGNECGEDKEPYWVSYFVVIFCGSLQYIANLYFNSKKAEETEYEKAVESFCSHIAVSSEDLDKAEAAWLRKELGSMAAENGHMKAILAAQLYSKDVVFNNDEDISFDGEHARINRFRLNAAVIDKYPMIKDRADTVVLELSRISTFLEQNKNLMIPKSKIHPDILKVTRNNPVTGSTIFRLCECHMLMIAMTENNKYTVVIDNNLLMGIPDAFTFLGEFIKALRAYNESFDDFEVRFISVQNEDEPCSTISVPVPRAVTDSEKTIIVKGTDREIAGNPPEKVHETDSPLKQEVRSEHNEIKATSGKGQELTVDPEAIIKELQKKYPNGTSFISAYELFSETEYLSEYATIAIRTKEVFGMPLNKYLISIGLLQKRTLHRTEKKKSNIICSVLPTAVNKPFYYITSSSSIRKRDYVEVPLGTHNNLVSASVQEVIECDEDSAPCDVHALKSIKRKLSLAEYNTGLLGSILQANAAIETDELISNASCKTFSMINGIPAKIYGSVAWACCRGIAADVIGILAYLIEKDGQIYEYKDIILIEKGISELYIFGTDVLDVLAKFPDVKIAMFSEDSQSGKAHLCYSRSGYPTITDTYVIGDCDIVSRSRWTFMNSPTEDFKTDNFEYIFKFRDDWEALNYVFTDEDGSRKQLGKSGE